LLRAVENSFWSLNALAIQPGYVAWRELLLHLSRRLKGAGPSETTQARGRALFDDLKDMFERQPLLLGGIGLAVGSVVAASFPSSRLENDLFGDSSNTLKQGLKDKFTEHTEQAVDTTREAFESLKD